jgi:hypothetical protein
MKNEWNLFDVVSRALAAGQQVVTVRRYCPPAHAALSATGHTLAYDDEEVEYEIGLEFVEALQLCIREQRVSWSMTQQSEFVQLYKFGPGVGTEATDSEPTPPGTTTINLLELDPNDPKTHQIFEDIQRSIAGEDEYGEGEEWKKLLD